MYPYNPPVEVTGRAKTREPPLTQLQPPTRRSASASSRTKLDSTARHALGWTPVSQRFQVVIVGGGPVGMALAVELGRRGVTVAVVERHRTPQRIPKGQSLTQRSLEHFYFWGVEPELRQARLLPPGYPIGSLTAYGNLMSDFWFGPD